MEPELLDAGQKGYARKLLALMSSETSFDTAYNTQIVEFVRERVMELANNTKCYKHNTGSVSYLKMQNLTTAVLSVTLLTLSTLPVLAKVCRIADPTDTALNVRAKPNGKIINRLRNGRRIQILRYKDDAKGRPWGFVASHYKGEYRQWGWVFMEAVSCRNETKNNDSIPTFVNIKYVSNEEKFQFQPFGKPKKPKKYLVKNITFIRNGEDISIHYENYPVDRLKNGETKITKTVCKTVKGNNYSTCDGNKIETAKNFAWKKTQTTKSEHKEFINFDENTLHYSNFSDGYSNVEGHNFSSRNNLLVDLKKCKILNHMYTIRMNDELFDHSMRRILECEVR